MCDEYILEILKALPTIIIGCIAAYIAYRQCKTDHLRLKFELYDKRWRVYEEVRKILFVFRDENVKREDLIKFRTSVSEADFLFGPEIPKYIYEVYQHGVELYKWKNQYHEKPAGYDHNKVVAEMEKELTWLNEQFEPAKEKFKKYLDISK